MNVRNLVTSVSSFLLYNALHSSSGFELPAGQISLASQRTGASSDHYNTPNKIHVYHHCLKSSLKEFPWSFMTTYIITLTWQVKIFAYFKFIILLGMPVEMHGQNYGLAIYEWEGQMGKCLAWGQDVLTESQIFSCPAQSNSVNRHFTIWPRT